MGDSQGFLTYWDLNRGEIKSVNRQAHNGKRIDFVQYFDFEGKDMFVSGSQDDNCVKVWNRQDGQDVDYYNLRKRQGCTEEMKAIRFYDDEGFHLIGYSGSAQSEIIDFSVLREDMTTKVSQKINNKGMNKYTKTERDDVIGQVMDFSFSTNRARDWANLMTANKHCFKPCLWDLESHSIVKTPVVLFDKGRANKSDFVGDLGKKKRFVSRVAVTNCGNFGIAGFSDGYLVKISMQNGGHVRTFFNTAVHQEKEIRGILVDSLNHSMITADQNTIAMWDFYSGLFQRKVMQTGGELTRLCPDTSSSVFGAVVGGSSVSVFEFHSLKQVRKFDTVKNNEILDCYIIFNERKVVISTKKGGLEIWDIFTEKLVSRYKLEKNVVSLAINADLSFLATVFEGERHVRLWHINKLSLFFAKPIKLVYTSQIRFVGENKREHYFGSREGENEEKDITQAADVDEQFYSELEEAMDGSQEVAASSSARKGLIGFTDIPQNKWMPLNYIDAIEKRNKPEKTQTVEVPFFLDFDNPLNRIKQEMESEVMKKETAIKSKIVKTTKKNEHLEDASKKPSLLLAAIPGDQLGSKESKRMMRELFALLCTQSASYINYFMRSCVFEDAGNVDKMLYMLLVVMRDSGDFDIKTVMLKSFIEAGYSYVGDSSGPILSRLYSVYSSKISSLSSSYDYVYCMLDRLSTLNK